MKYVLRLVSFRIIIVSLEKLLINQLELISRQLYHSYLLYKASNNLGYSHTDFRYFSLLKPRLSINTNTLCYTVTYK